MYVCMYVHVCVCVLEVCPFCVIFLTAGFRFRYRATSHYVREIIREILHILTIMKGNKRMEQILTFC
jgi:hypothetical protein